MSPAPVPIVAYFTLTRVPRFPPQAMPILALPAGAALAAMVPVFLLHW